MFRDGKIIQIIPNYTELHAHCESEDSMYSVPIVCFALLECDKTQMRWVEPIVMDFDGVLEPLQVLGEFKEIRDHKTK